MNGYGALSAFYDRLMTGGVDDAARADYWLHLFKKHAGRAPKTLLDLACGTGTLCAEMSRRGIETIGVDHSEEMLAAATVKVKNCTPEVLLLCQDMRSLDLRDTVDGAVCTQDGMNHLLTTADVRAALSRLRLFISPGGLFLFDVNTPYKHREILGNRDFVLEEDGVVCTWQNLYTKSTGIVEMRLDFFEEMPDGSYRRTADEVRERAYTLPTWRRLLTGSGFSLEAVYADGTTDPPEDDGERWVLVAKNRRPAEEYTES